MRKVLLLSTTQSFSRNSFDFVNFLGNGKGFHLKGLFFPGSHDHSTYESLNTDGDVATQSIVATAPAVVEFESVATMKGIQYSVQMLKNDFLQEIQEESKFADVLVCDASLSPVNLGLGLSPFVRKVLADAKCPVIVAPVKFDELEEIVFTYDGSDTSMHAIKQFTYLFPDFSEIPVSILQILPAGTEVNKEHGKLIDLLKYHYNSLSFTAREGEEAEIELFRQFVGKKNALLVMGAYGRKMIVNERSTADILLRNIDTPMFIAHF